MHIAHHLLARERMRESLLGAQLLRGGKFDRSANQDIHYALLYLYYTFIAPVCTYRIIHHPRCVRVVHTNSEESTTVWIREKGQRASSHIFFASDVRRPSSLRLFLCWTSNQRARLYQEVCTNWARFGCFINLQHLAIKIWSAVSAILFFPEYMGSHVLQQNNVPHAHVCFRERLMN